MASSMGLPLDCQSLFSQYDCPASKVSELVSGVKLAKAINQIFFEGKNTVLANQIITQNQERKGNNVINLNIILKQLRNNSSKPCPPHIQQLTTFKLIDNEQEMVEFVKWLVSCQQQKKNYPTRRLHNNQQMAEGIKENLMSNLNNPKNLNGAEFIVRNKKQPMNYLPLQRSQQQAFDPNDYGVELHKQIQQDQMQPEENIFQNVFFLDRDLSQEKDIELNDSLEKEDRVSKKGSFKVIRPKTGFENQNSKQESKETDKQDQIQSPQKSGKVKQHLLKNKTSQTQAFNRYYSDEKQSPSRKTISKIPDRPPLNRKLIKEQRKNQTEQKQSQTITINNPKPFLSESQCFSLKGKSQEKTMQTSNVTLGKYKNSLQLKAKNEALSGEINKIEDEIKKERLSSQNRSNRDGSEKGRITNTSIENSRTKSNRKIFKIDIKEVNQSERRSIIQWLISINLLNSMATNYFHRFHEICKNGVIFPQILNHYLGRSSEICYFKNPLKSAEMHSNYQKVFSYLKEQPSFQSNLLFLYEYFIPEALQTAFWSLLKSCQQCFHKGNTKKSLIFNRDSIIKEKLKLSQGQTEFNSRVKTQRYDNNNNNSYNLKKTVAVDEYQQIRYGSSNKFKPNSRRQSQAKQQPRGLSVQKETQSKRKSSLDFIKQLPEAPKAYKHAELVQVQQPVQISRENKGYRDLHQMKKSHNSSNFLHTPKKKPENSINRSRIVSTNSVKKLPQKPQIPSITLEMQMKGVKYLKEKGYLNSPNLQNLSLFEDPVRNGVLFNRIISDQLKINTKYSTKPRNIVDCRQNFQKGFSSMKQSFVIIPNSYQFYFQDIIKGELTLFYGLIWHIVNASLNKGFVNVASSGLKNQSAILNISKNNSYHAENNEKMLQQILFWIRQIEQENPSIAEMKIRDYNNLSINITNNNLLYKITTFLLPEKYTIKPTYDHPVNSMEQQSNLKKILSFLSHNKVLKSDMVWKAKSVIKKQQTATLQLMKSLMNYSRSIRKSSLGFQHEDPVVSFVKFVRPHKEEDMIKGNERNNQRLQTTMANNSFGPTNLKKQEPKMNKKPQTPIEIPWMRSLGFIGDLSLNNGVILCRLISKLTMQTVICNENPTSKAQCLSNIRKALKLIDKFRWDQQDIASADQKMTGQMYKFIREKYKHSYALKAL